MFVTNWNPTTKIQKISEITNFFRHYFLSRTEVLTFHEGDEEEQFGVTMKAKKDGKETTLDLFDSDFIGMCYNGMKMVFSQITYLYVKNLHDTGRMSDEEYNAIMAHAGQQPQSKADNEEE